MVYVQNESVETMYSFGMPIWQVYHCDHFDCGELSIVTGLDFQIMCLGGIASSDIAHHLYSCGSLGPVYYNFNGLGPITCVFKSCGTERAGKTIVMISYKKEPFGLHGLYKIYFSVVRVNSIPTEWEFSLLI